ncbi:8331_t:CDS:2, partial [Scutellospora calospora]
LLKTWVIGFQATSMIGGSQVGHPKTRILGSHVQVQEGQCCDRRGNGADKHVGVARVREGESVGSARRRACSATRHSRLRARSDRTASAFASSQARIPNPRPWCFVWWARGKRESASGEDGLAPCVWVCGYDGRRAVAGHESYLCKDDTCRFSYRQGSSSSRTSASAGRAALAMREWKWKSLPSD